MREKEELIQELSQFVAGLKENIQEEFDEEATPFFNEITNGSEFIDADRKFEELRDEKDSLLDYLERILDEIKLC